MSLSQTSTVTCDRCDNDMEVDPSDVPTAIQRAGWHTLRWVVFGASMDSDSLRKRDLCRKCSDEFVEWL